jgi:AcrR family transcriptional regulator
MVQVLKDEVKQAIADAALDVFATEGFGRATMADIARRAGVSTGNVYRYFESKDALLAAVLPAEVPRRLTRLLRQRMQSFGSAADAHALASEELLAFTIEHRQQVVFLLARAGESPYERFAERTIDVLVELAGERFSELRPASTEQHANTRQLVLRQIYENLVVSTARILERFSEPAQIRAAVADYGTFHLGGLVALLRTTE